MKTIHPREVLLGAQAASQILPVCDHYSGVSARMEKSLALQAEMIEEFGSCVFDATLDCEDGAPVGGEIEHAHLIAELINKNSATNNTKKAPQRIGVRVHPVDHPSFPKDIEIITKKAGKNIAYIMLPKVETAKDIEKAQEQIKQNTPEKIPLHALIESPNAVHNAYQIAAHSAIESISFGLMDFVSTHGGAITAEAMSAKGQFQNPLVVRAKLEISSAAHANAKVPSHCVITEFKDMSALETAAKIASKQYGYTRMWSIHPGQIRTILKAFSPSDNEIHTATEILTKAAAQNWAPIEHKHTLHDRASYRHYWLILERANKVGAKLPKEAKIWFNQTTNK